MTVQRTGGYSYPSIKKQAKKLKSSVKKSKRPIQTTKRPSR